MENSEKTPKRRWSLTRKAQVVGATFVFLLTSALVAYDVIPFTVPRGGLSEAMFDLFILVMAPADLLARGIGISDTLGYWDYRLLAVAINPVLVFCAIGFIGWLIAKVGRKLKRGS